MPPRHHNTMDPSEWMKPKQQRPVRRSLYGALRKESNVKCLILTAMIYGCIVAIIWCRVTRVTKVDIDFTAFPITSTREISPCDDGTIYIPAAFVVMLYLLYLVECWHCKAWHQLKFEKTDLNSAYQKIHEVRQAQAEVWWKAVCYHYVRRTREITRYRNGNAYTCTQVYYERVNSHVAAGCFFFALCGMKDVSRELIDLEKHAATKIQLSKGFLFANLATAREFQEQRAAFFQEQERYDDYMEMREGMDLSNVHFKESLISWASPENPPWFAKIPVFWLCNFLLLSWPLRLILELNTAHLHYQVNKLFGVNYMSPSGSELLLSAPRSHGLPINNHQHRIHNRAISSHHSRLTGPNSRRRRSVVADVDQEESAPLLLHQQQDQRRNQNDGRRSSNPYLNNNNNNKLEKDPNELCGDPSKNLNKDQQTNNNDNDNENENSVSATQNNNDTDDVSPSSSSSRIFFPQWRSSFFSRNFRFARQSGYKLTRSVTLLMTKPERLQFLASTHQQQFPDEFGYFGDSDEGARLLNDGSYSPSCSSPPPPPFLTPSPEEDEEVEEEEARETRPSYTHNDNSSSIIRNEHRRLTQHLHHDQRRQSLGMTSADGGGDDGGANCLAPSYSQALLLMEPNESESVRAYSANETRNPSSTSSSSSPPPPPPPFLCTSPGFDPNLTNERRSQEHPPGFGDVNEIQSNNNPGNAPCGQEDEHPSGGESGTHYLGEEDRQRSAHQDNNCSGGTTSGNPSAASIFSSERSDTNHVHPHHDNHQQPSAASESQVDTNDHGDGDHDDGDVRCSQERASLGQQQHVPNRQQQSSDQQQQQRPCSSSSSSYSVAGGGSGSSSAGHYRRASSQRLPSSGSSLVLNSIAPRELTGVQIDLTQPIVVTVPRDPIRESASLSAATVTSSSSSSRRVSHNNSSSGSNSNNNGRANHNRHIAFSGDDEPPTYFEALRTSRPVFLPALARIRRCFTERDIASRFTSNRTLWLHEIVDADAEARAGGGCIVGSNNNSFTHHHHNRHPHHPQNDAQRRQRNPSGDRGGSGGGGSEADDSTNGITSTTTSRV